METKVKSNGTAKRQNATVKKEVQKKLTDEAIGKTVTTEKKKTQEKPVINLDDRIQKFENTSSLHLKLLEISRYFFAVPCTNPRQFKTFCENNITRTQVSNEDLLKQANNGIESASWALDVLKELVIDRGFRSVKEEIRFFKSIKTQPMRYLIHYTEVRSCELRCPKTGVDNQQCFLDNQMKKVNHFFSRHTDFLLYMEQGYTHFDEHYFTRKHLNNVAVTKSYPYYKDTLFNTSHDEIWARIQGLGLYANYLKNKKEVFCNVVDPNLKQNKKNAIFWTGSYASFVEMAYGLIASGHLNNGNIDVKKVMEELGNFLNVPQGNHSRTYNELKSRKESRIKFFEETGQKLLKKMDDEDGLDS